jgi:protein-histidine pros-kinase
MRLLMKFSLVFIVMFALGLGAVGYLFYGSLQASAREQVRSQARVIMETALAVRAYTAEQVKPALNAEMRRADDFARQRNRCEEASGEPHPARPPKRLFRQETVPAYAAISMFEYLRQRHPEYFYKEAALNPTNPRNRAVDWEQDIIKTFRNHPELKTFDGERDTPFGRSLYVARPMRAERACLECHSTPAAAPPEMLRIYGSANGFGWEEEEIVAAQIVSVPASVPLAMADQAFRRILVSFGVVAVVALVLLDVALYFTVVRPVGRLASMADEISKGNLEVPELPVKGRDEISVLAAAFNRMHRSLTAAMKLLQK